MKIKVNQRWLTKQNNFHLKEITILEISPSKKYYKTADGWSEYIEHTADDFFHELLPEKKDINN